MSKPFAKIVIATDGAQVLFYTGLDDDSEVPVLHCISMSKDGHQGDFMVKFMNNDEGEAASYRALESAGVSMADRVRQQLCAVMGA